MPEQAPAGSSSGLLQRRPPGRLCSPWQTTERCFQGAADSRPVWAERSFALQALGNLDRAQEAAAESLRLDPKYDLGHFVNGVIYMDQGEDDEAAEAFEEFLELYWDRAYARQFRDQAEQYLEQRINN